MKIKLSLTLSALIITGALLLTSAPARSAAAVWNDDDNLRERDEVNETYKLAPGAEVAVHSISGSVKVETADTDAAEIHIVRSARTREELDCRPVHIEHADASLRIDGNDQRRQCRNVQVRQEVTLRLPRRINLTVESVSGHVNAGNVEGSVNFTSISGHATVGNVNGPVQFTSISGHATVGDARGPVKFNSISGHVDVASALDAASFNSISGHVTINLARLGARGLRVSSVSGSVDVGLSDDVNADLRVESISGDVIADGARITVTKLRENEFTGRVGSGGAPMEFFSISGNIRLHRAGV
jgi:DUF4097 and DUF4098 domain-containing protein YvlB